MLNVAVWGLGTHAFKNVLPAVVASGAAKLVGVCSREEASRRRASREFGCAAWPDATAMLADDRVNTVYLATPIGLHFEQGLNVLRSGRHLICEKSLTDSHVKSIGLVAEARQRRLLSHSTARDWKPGCSWTRSLRCGRPALHARVGCGRDPLHLHGRQVTRWPATTASTPLRKGRKSA